MKMKVGKTYLVKKDIFSFKKGEFWSLVDIGYHIYFGEHNFVFINEEKRKEFAVLCDSSDKDMQIYHQLEAYFEKVE